ncbi:uncharacterized protein LOC141600765 [Silene latifolia]|uniref:uncharacterized protein LOC141600765 n=1 Tax=Silene latifolia TaxID=37657 RepID=UPI003D779A20
MVSASDQQITVAVEDLNAGEKFWFTVVYGSNSDSDRIHLWHDSNTRVYSRIDRFLINHEWLSLYPNSYAYFLNEGLFDHNPCICYRRLDRAIRKTHFRYFNMWGQASDFLDIVRSEWEESIMGCKMFQVVSKLKCLKKPLKQLNRAKFSDIEKAADLARLLLDNIQTKLHQTPLDQDLLAAEKDAVQKYTTLHKARMSFLRQKAKVEWLKEGDENTAFFHRHIKARHMHNKVLSITDIHSTHYTYPVHIESSFLEFYQELLGSSKVTSPVHTPTVRRGSLVNDAHVHILMKPVTDTEIQNCFFSIPSNKAPGPDGFSSQFCKDAWPLIGADI